MTTESAQLQNASKDRLDALDACELAEHDRDGYRIALSRERGEHRATRSALIDARRRADASESALSMLRATLERERAEHRDTRRALELVEEDRDDAIAKGARADRMVAHLREQITAAHDVLGARMDESLLSCCQRTANRLIQWEMRFDRDYGAEWLGPCAHGCPDSADCAECESLPLAEVVIQALHAEAKRAMDAREECARLSAANAALTDEIDRLILDRAEWMRRAERARMWALAWKRAARAHLGRGADAWRALQAEISRGGAK